MKGYRATLLIVCAVMLCSAGAAEAGKENVRRTTAGSAASGDLAPEAWKTACAGMGTGSRRPASED